MLRACLRPNLPVQVGKEETFMDSIKREIAIMKKVNHPNVLRLYEVMDDPKVPTTREEQANSLVQLQTHEQGRNVYHILSSIALLFFCELLDDFSSCSILSCPTGIIVKI